MLLPAVSFHHSTSTYIITFSSNAIFNISSERGRRKTTSNFSKHRHSFLTRSSMDKEETKEEKSELDNTKAREALQKLDQQLQSLSQEEDQLPKSRTLSTPYSELNLDRDEITGMNSVQEMPEIFTKSYFSYAAVVLFIITIINNVIFNLVIKPSVDGAEKYTPVERMAMKEP